MNTTPAQPTDPQSFVAFQRMMSYLDEHQVDQETRTLLFGRLVKKVMDQVLVDTIAILGGEGIKEVESIPDEVDKQARVEQLFQEKKGMSIQEYREKLAEDVVREFEAQEE